MNVDFAFLCDYADNTAKLTAVGIGFDTIYSPTLPARLPLFFAVIALRFSITESGQKKLGLRAIDADGNDVIPPQDKIIDVASPPPGYLQRVERVAFGLHGVGFAKYGDYSIRWLVDGHEVQTLPLKVAPPPQQPRTA